MGEYYEPIMPDGHRLGSSRRNADAFSGNSFDEAGNLGRPDWRQVDTDDGEEVAPDPSNTVLTMAIGLAVGVVGTIAVRKAVPYITSRWEEFRSRRNRDPDSSEADTAETVEVGAISAEQFLREVDAALVEQTSMSSAEAQERVLAVLMAAAFIADQMRTLSNAWIEDQALPELDRAMARLSSPQVTDSINRMLEADSRLLNEETSARFMGMFGGGRSLADQYVPVRNEKIRHALRLTDGAGGARWEGDAPNP